MIESSLSVNNSAQHVLRNSLHKFLAVFNLIQSLTEGGHVFINPKAFGKGFAELEIFNDVDSWLHVQVYYI